MNLTEEQLQEVVDNLDGSMRCLYNKKTGEVVTVFGDDDIDWVDYAEEWKKLRDKIEENWDDYFEFEPMGSREAFEVMADFVETVGNQELQHRLRMALEMRKPFSKFKGQIDHAGEYRQRWFDFKNQKLIEFVKKQIELHKLESENE